MQYLTSDLLEVIGDIEFDEDPDETEGEGEAKLRELYHLPNIKQDEAALLAVVEYTESKEGDYVTLEQVETYAKLFVEILSTWGDVAQYYLEDQFGDGIIAFYPHMDLDAIGQSVGNDLGGYFALTDGRIACFNKKEGS